MRRYAKTAVTFVRQIPIRKKKFRIRIQRPPQAHFFLPPHYERASCDASACRQSETDSRTGGTRVAPPLLQIGGRLAAHRLQIGGRLAALRSPTVSVSVWRRCQGAWRVLSPSSDTSLKKRKKRMSPSVGKDSLDYSGGHG